MPFFGGGGDYKIVGTNIRGGNDALTIVVGVDNIALGNGAQSGNIDGDSNIAIGNLALSSNVDGSTNVVVGNNSLNGGDPGEWFLSSSETICCGNNSLCNSDNLPPPF